MKQATCSQIAYKIEPLCNEYCKDFKLLLRFDELELWSYGVLFDNEVIPESYLDAGYQIIRIEQFLCNDKPILSQLIDLHFSWLGKPRTRAYYADNGPYVEVLPLRNRAHVSTSSSGGSSNYTSWACGGDSELSGNTFAQGCAPHLVNIGNECNALTVSSKMHENELHDRIKQEAKREVRRLYDQQTSR